MFDDFGLAGAARLALERALVMIWLVWLDTGKPHRRVAIYAARMFDFLK